MQDRERFLALPLATETRIICNCNNKDSLHKHPPSPPPPPSTTRFTENTSSATAVNLIKYFIH